MVGEALGLPDAQRGRQGVLAALTKGRRLLILDNLEQLDGAAEVVDAIVESAAGCALIATSRRALHVHGEREYLVSPLTVPVGDRLDAVRDSGAVAMFVEHAQRVRRDFALTEQSAGAVAELCRRLDGLPLAVELVAARVKFQTPASLLKGLDGLLDLASMTTDAEHRQATVRRTISWSYELLSQPQQRVLECFGVFEGGADLDALDAVADDDDFQRHSVLELLYDLVDASLVSVHDTVDGADPVPSSGDGAPVRQGPAGRPGGAPGQGARPCAVLLRPGRPPLPGVAVRAARPHAGSLRGGGREPALHARGDARECARRGVLPRTGATLAPRRARGLGVPPVRPRPGRLPRAHRGGRPAGDGPVRRRGDAARVRRLHQAAPRGHR